MTKRLRQSTNVIPVPKALVVTAKDSPMSIEYLLVNFPEERAVLADDTNVGFTNHMLMLPADEYQISLAGGGFQPSSQDVVLAGTSIVKPMVVVFTTLAPEKNV